jgi:hypothetical protein
MDQSNLSSVILGYEPPTVALLGPAVDVFVPTAVASCGSVVGVESCHANEMKGSEKRRTNRLVELDWEVESGEVDVEVHFLRFL